MFIVNSYLLAVVFCFITMLCWGSWGNTQKLAGKTWRYELFYWDYVIGMVLFALVLGFTMGSIGSEGRPFVEDLMQADGKGIISVLIGGVIFNASNILLSASVSLAGMSVAFPLGVGLALVLGVIINYMGAPKGDPTLLFIGVALVVVAIICNGLASGRMTKSGEASASNRKGIILSMVAGVLMSFFYRFVAAAMDLDNFEQPTAGMLTPYSAIFVFSCKGEGGKDACLFTFSLVSVDSYRIIQRRVVGRMEYKRLRSDSSLGKSRWPERDGLAGSLLFERI